MWLKFLEKYGIIKGMGKIVCLMGKSSSGKDTVYKKLLSQRDVWLQPIVPYTTRPIRAGEQEGVEYHFTDEAEFQRLLAQGKVVEHRAYDTCYGVWRYYTVADDCIDLHGQSYLMIGTPEAYNRLCDFYGKEYVLPVMIELDDGVRLQRALDREKAQDHPKYAEMCRRYLADMQDFSEEKLARAGIERSFYNDSLEGCIEEIVEYLRGRL